MSSSVRLTSGAQIQIRTGVVQGIGPQGPVGPSGPQGGTGPAGQRGEPGPAGRVLELSTHVRGTIAASIASGTPTLVAFDSVRADDFNAVASQTNFAPPAGIYYVSAWVTIPKRSGNNAVGSRTIRILRNGSTVVATSIAAPPTVDCELNIATAMTVSAGEIIQIQALQDEGFTLQITASRMWISRIGPGTTGPAGAVGAQGPAGPTGAVGPAGPAGTVTNNTTTFSDLGSTTT